MILEKYGVTLCRLTEDKIELVRNWRNDPKISKYMEFQDYITPEMQQKWFRKINNDNNYFFVIEFERKDIGIVNVKDIDFGKKNGEAGIFIYDDSYLNSTLSYRIMLNILDFCFEQLGLSVVLAHIRRDNDRAIKFNSALGFRIVSSQDNILNQQYELKSRDYFLVTEKIRHILK